jgi:hypothetical protein
MRPSRSVADDRERPRNFGFRYMQCLMSQNLSVLD